MKRHRDRDTISGMDLRMLVSTGTTTKWHRVSTNTLRPCKSFVVIPMFSRTCVARPLTSAHLSERRYITVLQFHVEGLRSMKSDGLNNAKVHTRT